MHAHSRALTAATAAIIAVAFAAPAVAVTGGEADGNGHPSVGLLLYSGGDGLYSCTGTLIAPTVVLTDAAQKWKSDPGRWDALLARIPLGRVADPRDVVGAALFFCSAASDFVTGQVLYLDGGLTATQ